MARKKYHRTASLLSAQPNVRTPRREGLSLHLPWQLLVGALLLAGIALWLWLDPRWYLESSRVQIAGTDSLPLAKEAVLAGEALNQHSLWIDSATVITKVLNSIPAVEAAELDCRPYPAYCLFTLSEREPVLAWKTEGVVQWVDAEGLFFAAREERPELPSLQGPKPEEGKLRPMELAASVRNLVELGVPPGELHYHPQKGIIWDNPQGWQVFFGQGAQQMENRWRVYQTLLANLSGRGILPEMFDVRFPDAATYANDGLW